MVKPISLEQIREGSSRSPVEVHYESHHVEVGVPPLSREFVFSSSEKGWAPVVSDVSEPPAFEEVVISIDNCIVSSSGEVFTARGEAYESSEFGLRNHSGKRPPRFPLPRLEGVWIYGLHQYSSFGHWLANRIPKVVSASTRLSFDGLLLNEMPWKTEDIVRGLGIDPSQIRWLRNTAKVSTAQYFRVERLLIATEAVRRQPQRSVNVRRFDEVAHHLAINLGLSPNPGVPGGKRVYFSRTVSSAAHRAGCINRFLLEELARDNDFDTVYPEEFSFREQLELILGVSTLVCESGSAGMLSLLSRQTIHLSYLTSAAQDAKGQLRPNRRFPYARSGVLKRGGTFALGIVGEGHYDKWEARRPVSQFALATLPFKK